MKRNEVIFDVETKNLFSDIDSMDPGDLGISIVSAYVRELDENFNESKGQMYSFWEKEIDSLWDLFAAADRVIGFNTLNFDIPALQPYAPYQLSKIKNFDIMDEVKKLLGHRIGLSALAEETLGVSKTDVGTNAVIYYRKGDEESLAKLKKYCEADVLLTRDLYDHVLRNKNLKFKDKWNNLKSIEVDFSYPEIPNENQIGLF